MGVLNVTPDSFSDGGRWAAPEAAVSRARELIAQGADIIDIGGESTRPGAQRVDVDTEISRVLPVVRALLADGAGSADGTGAAGSAIVSVDTIHAATAEAAIDAGAHIINDVSGGLADPAMHGLIARTGVVYVCQHWRGDPETMDRLTDYPGGVVAGVEAELCERLGELDAAGQAILSRLSTENLADDAALADVVARLRRHPVLARTREMAMTWARQAVGVLAGLEDAVVAGTRERLEDAGASASERETTLAEARGRVGLVRAGMEEFARLLVDRAA